MDNTIYYVIGLFAFIAFLMMVSHGSDRTRNHRYQQGPRRNYNRNRRREYDDYYANDDYNQRGYDNGYHQRRDDEFGGVGMFIGIAFLLLIGYGVYRYNEAKPTAKTEIAEVSSQDSTQQQNEQQPDQDYAEDTAPDYSVDDYPNNNNGSPSSYDPDVGGIPDYYPQEYKDAAEQVLPGPTPTPVEVGTFYAQTGAYGQLENASNEQQKWIDQGYQTKVVVFKNGDGLYRVLVGGYFSAAEAKGFMGKKYEQVYDLAGGGYYEVR
ncbi:SPOR domain-containing protein [Haliscomenobacter hydrossis]|uniref:Sporulation domain-containing protein n=1 Tax=Haliscomenobacter hydrossis (strain ATCC 27775 / DSM 1100 / LMG 10767 / O) TaxID=760192 RepID=F4L034_HALH1|nr:SPOR domain-containing protein [Haliscomenobacter hydrossis]AEE52743.1 Sporulation domain-containing protein [Haliscomenobacter hydrossis DSM 1100]